MRARLDHRILLACLALLIGLLATPAWSQGGPFEDSFDDPNLTGWQRTPGVLVNEGILSLEPGGFASPEGTWGAFELIMMARYMGQGDIAFMYNLSEAGGSVLLYNGSRFEFQRESAGQIETIGEPIAFKMPAGEWFQFTMVVSPESQTVLVNEELIFDLPLNSPLSSGGFGFETHHQLVLEIDHFMMFPIGADQTDPGEESTESEPPETPTKRMPAYTNTGWTHLGGPIGGLGYDIRHSFEDHDIWYATDAWSGIHRSKDGGLTWEPINQGITAVKGVDAVPIFSATVDPHDSQVVWIGTESTGQIYRTNDGGDTWVERSNGIDLALRPLTFRGFTVDPKDQNTVFAMAEISSLSWTPDGQQRAGLEMDLTKGIVYKTTDGGLNWREVWRGENLARYAWIHPEDTNIIYVSTGIFDRESANTNVEAGEPGGVGILKSSDGGETWRTLDQSNGLLDLYIGSLYMHPEDPETLLAAASQNNWSAYFELNTAGIYLTIDGGETWERVLSGEELFGTVEYCEADPDIAYAASANAVYRSEDGGQTWQRYSRPDNSWGPPGIIAGLPIDMQCDPDDTDRLFINNYGGGNFLSEDGGQTWINASQGYSGASIRDVVIASGQPGWVYSSGRSGAFRSTDGGTTWTGLSNPNEDFRGVAMIEISALALHPEDPLTLLTAPSDLATAIMSVDGGNSWARCEGIEGSPIQITYAPSDASIVYAAVTHLGCIDSIQGSVMAEICEEAQNALYRSVDGGLTWASPTGLDLPGDGITKFAVHPREPDTLYAGTLTKSVITSTDGGSTWREISNGLPRGETVSALALDPSDPMTLFAGYFHLGLYRTDNGGENWNKVTSGLIPEAFIKSIVVDPLNNNIIYLADHFSGVYVSTDKGTTWKSLNNGLTHRTANALALSDDGSVLYVGIEGAGVYRLGTPPPVEGADILDVEVAAQIESQPEQEVTEEQESESPFTEEEDETGFSIPCIGGALPLLLFGIMFIIRRPGRR